MRWDRKPTGSFSMDCPQPQSKLKTTAIMYNSLTRPHTSRHASVQAVHNFWGRAGSARGPLCPPGAPWSDAPMAPAPASLSPSSSTVHDRQPRLSVLLQQGTHILTKFHAFQPARTQGSVQVMPLQDTRLHLMVLPSFFPGDARGAIHRGRPATPCRGVRMCLTPEPAHQPCLCARISTSG